MFIVISLKYCLLYDLLRKKFLGQRAEQHIHCRHIQNKYQHYISMIHMFMYVSRFRDYFYIKRSYCGFSYSLKINCYRRIFGKKNKPRYNHFISSCQQLIFWLLTRHQIPRQIYEELGQAKCIYVYNKRFWRQISYRINLTQKCILLSL